MGNAFRLQPRPTLYPENKTAVTEDLLQVGLMVAFGMIAFSFMLIIPGIRGWERLWAVLRVSIALWIGTVLLVCNFGYGWQKDSVYVQTQYKAFTDEEIDAEVGLHVGLRGVNITLKANPTTGVLAEENIDYNEQFWWAEPWAQGRSGYGRYAGRFNREYREAHYRGDPYPVLRVAEYFTIDGGNFRYGRKYRLAGWYTHILLWLCFAIYLISIILFFIDAIYKGAISLTLLGSLMVFASLSFRVIILNSPSLKLPWTRAGCSGQDCTVFLSPSFHWSWYLVLSTGIFTILLGLFILFMGTCFPHCTADVFHQSDLKFIGPDEVEDLGYGVTSKPVHTQEPVRTRRASRGMAKYITNPKLHHALQKLSTSTLIGIDHSSQKLKQKIPLETIQQEAEEPSREEKSFVEHTHPPIIIVVDQEVPSSGQTKLQDNISHRSPSRKEQDDELEPARYTFI